MQYIITYQTEKGKIITDSRDSNKYIDMLRDIASNIQKNKLILISLVLINPN